MSQMNNPLKVKGSPIRGLAGATLGFFFGSAAISLFGPSATKLNEVMDLTPSMMGLLVAIPTLSGSLLRIPFGASVDVNGGRKSFLCLMLLSIIGLAGLSFLLTSNYPNNMEGTYWLILFFGCLSGCGVATFSVGSGQTSYWYQKNKQGSALGIFGGFGTLGAGVFALVLPVLLSSIGFVHAYYVWTGCIIIGTIIYFYIGCNAYFFQYKARGFNTEESKKMAIEAGQELFPTGNIKESLMISAKIPETWILVIAYFVTFGGFMALTAWLPTFWQKEYGVTSSHAGFMTAAYACSAALLRIPGGKMSDKFGGIKVSLSSFVLLAIVSIVMAFSGNLVLSFISTLVIAIAFGFNNAAIMKLVPVYVSKSIGGASGWVGGLGAFGGFLIPIILGKIVTEIGTIGYSRGFLTFTILSTIVLVVLYVGLIVKNKNK